MQALWHQLKKKKKKKNTFPPRKKKRRRYDTSENALLHFVEHIKVNYDDVIILELSKELLGSDANVFLVNTYLNLHNIPMIHVVEKNADAFILCGDFNAKTRNKVPTYFDFA